MPAAKKTETNEQFDMNTVFNKLNAVNVNENTKQKNGLTYLSWAWAWAEVKKRYPEATFTIYERDTEYGPVNYFTDGKTCWVKTGVTINGLEHIEQLPVMNYANKSIPLASITSTDVNKAIQRSLTKAAARHGLGLYIYAGEDLPEITDGDGSTGNGDGVAPTKEKETDKKPAQPNDGHNADTAAVISEVDKKVKAITKDMDNAAKTKWGKEVIVPILGSMNYFACTDITKLTQLRDKLSA